MTKPTDGWVLYDSEGACIGRGTGYTEAQDGETLVLSDDPFNEPDSMALIEADEKQGKLLDVEAMKSPEEYAGKAENAIRWLSSAPDDDVGNYTAESYPWMALEIVAKSCTPRECAESIQSAMNRDGSGLAQAAKRIALREELRS